MEASQKRKRPDSTQKPNKDAKRDGSATRSRGVTDKNAPHTAHRGSDFLCKVKFGNTLPPIPFDPKLLELPFDPSRYSHYHTTSLETSYQHVLHTEPDLGIPLNLIDPDAYKIRQPKPSLEDEDSALIEPETISGKPKRPEASRPAVSWLRKHTEYISNDLSEVSKKTKREHPESIVGYASKKKVGEGKLKRTHKEIVEAIERGFAKAKQTPKHPTNPHLRPVEVIPVFPDFNLWQNTYSQVVFDDDPAPTVPDPKSMKTQQEEMELKAVVKGFSAGEGTEKQSFVAYLTPKLDEEDKLSEESYQWVREYIYRLEPKVENSYILVWTSDGVYYNTIGSKVLLDKIKTKAAKKCIKEHGRPEAIHVSKRDLTEEEKAQQEDREQIFNSAH